MKKLWQNKSLIISSPGGRQVGSGQQAETAGEKE